MVGSQLDAHIGKCILTNTQQSSISIFRSPYGKTFQIVDKSTSYENGTVHCLCSVRLLLLLTPAAKFIL